MNGRTKILFLTPRFLTALILLILANACASFGSTTQDVIFSLSDPDSISSSNNRMPLQYEFQNVEVIPESTERKENIPAESLPDATLKWYTMFTKIPSDWSLFATRTLRVESIPMIVGVVGVTGALYAIDHNTYSHTYDYERGSRQFRSFRDDLILFGDGRYQFGFVGSFALYGLIADDSRALKTASQMTEAILATGIVVQVLKRVAGRESPIVATQNRGAVHPFPNLADYQRHQPKYYSFPSGHIATTTAALTVLCENFPEAKWMRPMSYILIGAVGGSLVSKGWHWYSDLPLGIALGYSFGVIAAHPEGLDIKKSNSGKSLDVSVAPKLMSSGAELEMTVHF
jgi:membrane-associated phospholipid phosphatase